MKAVILAGGLGTRLRPYTKSLPKPMLPLGGKPILEYEIEWLKKNGIKEIVVCVSYLRKKIENYFGPYCGYSQQFLFKMEREKYDKKWL